MEAAFSMTTGMEEDTTFDAAVSSLKWIPDLADIFLTFVLVGA